MAYIYGNHSLLGGVDSSSGYNGWRFRYGTHTPAAPENLQFVHQHSLNPLWRWRAQKDSTKFTKHFTSASDGKLNPMVVFTPGFTVTPDAVVFNFDEANVSNIQKVLPNAVIFNLDAPDVFATTGTLTPSPVVFTFKGVNAFATWLLKPSAVLFSMVEPAHAMVRLIQPDPVVFDLNAIAGSVNWTLTPGAVIFNFDQINHSTFNSLQIVAPNPVVFKTVNAVIQAHYGKVAFPSSVVFDLNLGNTTTIPGLATLLPFPVRFLFKPPFPMAQFFIGSPATLSIKSVTYLARVGNAALGIREYPASSIQGTTRNLWLYEADNPDADTSVSPGVQDELSIQVPNGSRYLSELTSYLNSVIKPIVQIIERVTYTNGYISDRTVGVSTMSDLDHNKGPRNDTVTIRCQVQSMRLTGRAHEVPQERIREARSTVNGGRSIRLAYDINEVRASRVQSVGQMLTPGDILTADGTPFQVRKAGVHLSTGDRYIEVSSEDN